VGAHVGSRSGLDHATGEADGEANYHARAKNHMKKVTIVLVLPLIVIAVPCNARPYFIDRSDRPHKLISRCKAGATEPLVKEKCRLLLIKVPKAKMATTLRFVTRVNATLDSMESYLLHNAEPGKVTFQRKDLDSLDRAVADARGQVPREIVAYAQDAYDALRTGDDDMFWARSQALEAFEFLNCSPSEHCGPRRGVAP